LFSIVKVEEWQMYKLPPIGATTKVFFQIIWGFNSDGEKH
jgi:hypothetical protein